MSVVQLEGGGGGGGVTSHAALTGLAADDHLQYLLLAGRAGGQSALGGLNAGDNLVLAGSAHAGGGNVMSDSPIQFRYSEGNTTPAEQFSGIWAETFTTVGAYIGGFLRNDSAITYTNSFYIYASVVDRSQHISNAAAGFQAFTLFNALPRITNGTFNDLVQMIILNDGGVHERSTSGTSVATQHVGVGIAPQIKASSVGATMTWSSGATGLQFAPKFSTVAGSTINMGTLIGLDCFAPTTALFQPQLGIENITNYYGVNFQAMTNAVSGEMAVVHSSMIDAANRFFLKNDGGARSTFGGGLLLDCGFVQCFADNVGLSLGAGGGDVIVNWNGSALEFDPMIGNDMRISFSATTGHLFQSAGATDQVAFNYPQFAFGQSGAVGNQVGVFVANTRTVSIGGEWTDFLLTQAGNITVDAAMSLVAGWTVNAPSITIGTGSVTTAAGLNVGGNPTNATNRVGVRIISNPTGGGGVNAALWVTAGRSQFDGFVDINKPIALGGGAAATLGTIGGSGPTTAAQAQWVEIEVNGVRHWIPAWT